ncbi:MAG TPA: YCF48-related protein, partial [Nevskiaceae bacterium]|nr:YCF48-related protein [Nevskiaceae bacterium]
MLKTRTLWAVAVAVGVGVTGAIAQDESAPAAEDAAAPAEGADASGSYGDSEGSGEESTEAAEAPAPPVKPRPAEKMPLASKSLLLGIVNTGRHIVAVGDRGNIVVSNDGDHWAQVEVPVRATLTAVTFIDDKQGWAVGHDAAVLHTGDGGRTWQLQNFQPELEKPLLAVYFADAQKGLAVGAYGLMLQTADGGTSWSELDAASIREDE